MSIEKVTATRTETTEGKQPQDSWVELVRRKVGTLKFGTVQITVHDARVTQVERLDKVRLDRLPSTTKSTNQTTGA